MSGQSRRKEERGHRRDPLIHDDQGDPWGGRPLTLRPNLTLLSGLRARLQGAWPAEQPQRHGGGCPSHVPKLRPRLPPTASVPAL